MLKLIKGGGPEPPSNFKKHYLHEDIWRALYPKPAYTFDEIYDRVVKSHRGPRPTKSRVASGIMHIRANADDYEWTIPHVQKGRGDLRLYFVVLVDGSDSYVQPEYMDNLLAGLVSTGSTIGSMAQHGADALEIAAGLSIFTRGEKKQLRGYSGSLQAVHEMMQQMLRKLEK